MDIVEDGHTTRKRSRNKKKKIEEIEKPRGLARGLPPEKILAAQLHHDILYVLVKWEDCLEVDVVPGHELGVAFPEFIIDYYERCGPFSVKNTVWKTPRVAPELPEESNLPDVSMESQDLQDTNSVNQPAEIPDLDLPDSEAPAMDTTDSLPEISVN